MAPTRAANGPLQKGTEGVPVPLVPTSPDINIILMEQPSPRDRLALLNLSLDVQLVDDIMEIVNQPHGLGLTHPLDPLSIYAIACIVAESKRLLAVDSHSLVMGGLPTERFLAQVQHENRLALIWRINELVPKWPWCLGELSRRVQTIRTSFLRFLQGRQAFGRLATEIREPFQLVLNHFKLLWLAYVQIKQNPNNYNNHQGDTALLLNLLKCLFSDYLYHLSPQLVDSALETVFMQEARPDQDCHWCNKQLDSVFLNVIGLRQARQDHETLVHYLSDVNLTARMVDDMKKNILANHRQLGFQQVDETIFLDMDYALSPMSLIRYNSVEASPIRIKLSFDDCDSSEFMEAQEFKHSFLNNQGNKQQPDTAKKSEDQFIQRRQNLGQLFKQHRLRSPDSEAAKEQGEVIYRTDASPSRKTLSPKWRMEALKWAQLSIISKEPGTQASFYQLYQNIFGEQFQEFRNQYSRLVRKIIEKHTPGCLDVQARCRKTMELFMGMIEHLMNLKSESQLRLILKKPSELGSFICIALILLNYIYKSPVPYSMEIVKIFGINAREAFIPINWIGKNFGLIPCLKDYLREVEGHLLLFALWSSQDGFTLLENLKQKNVTYLDKAIEHRLRKHIGWRISEMTDGDLKLQEKIKTIVNGVIQHRSILLRYNNINLIIIASYAVSLPEDNHQPSLTAIARWRDLTRSIPEELIAKDFTGAIITFEAFVDNIFKREADFMLNKRNKNNILCANNFSNSGQFPSRTSFFRMGERSPYARPVGIRTWNSQNSEDCHKSSIIKRVNFDRSPTERN